MKAIIFDFDGTIADSFELVLDLYYELTGHPPFTQEEIAEYKGLTMRKAMKVVHLSPRQIPLLIIKGRAQMGQRLHEVKPFHDMKSVLQTLHEEGNLLLVMSSNSHQNVETFLKSHKLNSYIDTVYGGVGLLSKASALRKVLRQNKLDANKCFYVGDEVRDIVAAKRAHVRSVAVTWGYNNETILARKKPNIIAKTPDDLLRKLSQYQN